MPELPEIEAYLSALRRETGGEVLEGVRLQSLFLVHSVEPPLETAVGRRVTGFSRIGKRIVMALEGELFLVLHLMVTGRLRWRKCGAGLPGKAGLAAFDFPRGSLILTEAGSRRAPAPTGPPRRDLGEPASKYRNPMPVPVPWPT